MKDTYLYLGVCVVLSATGTALLLAGRIDQTVWSGLIQWLWTSVVAGGAASAYRPKVTK